VLRAIPALSGEYEIQAESINIQFTGDPSYMAYNGAAAEEEPEEGAPPVERFREIHRVAYVVKVKIYKLSKTIILTSFFSKLIMIVHWYLDKLS
jgi:hypothetical protein